MITPRKIDGNYLYERTEGMRRILHIFWYRIIALPMAFVYLKLVHRHKIIGREKIKKERGACFIYGNHTQATADALIPTFLSFPRPASIVVHPNNVSMKFLGRITPYMGALPLPDDMDATRNFSAIIKKRTEQKRPVFIYPEAHIWPYYTSVRPFGDASFSYPVKYGTAVFCFTNTYHKKGRRKRPRIISYIDGPFYPDETLSPRDRRQDLRNKVYAAMTERAALSDVEFIKYVDGRE